LLVGDAGLALADDASVGRDIDGIYPVQSVDVEMVSENITIELFTSEGSTTPGLYSRARCEFVFRNKTSTPLDVLMAFPAELAASESGLEGDPVIRDFRAFDGETELPVALEPASAGPVGEDPIYSSWYTFTVRFEPGEQHTVVNTYWVRNSYNSIGEVWVRYILKTGATWSGPIGKATVTLLLGSLGPQHLLNYYPGDWRFAPDGRSLVWQRENFEPTFDLSVYYSIREFAGRPDNAPERRPEFEKLIAEGPALPPEQLLALYAAVVTANDPAKVAMVRAFLPPSALAEHPPTLDRIEVLAPGATSQETEPVLEVAYSDAGGDLVLYHIEVTYKEQGEVVQYYDNLFMAEQFEPLWARFSWTERVRLGGIPEGKQYRVLVQLTDAAGRKLEVIREFGEQRPTRPAWLMGAVVAGATLAAAAAGATLALIRKRRSRTNREA